MSEALGAQQVGFLSPPNQNSNENDSFENVDVENDNSISNEGVHATETDHLPFQDGEKNNADTENSLEQDGNEIRDIDDEKEFLESENTKSFDQQVNNEIKSIENAFEDKSDKDDDIMLDVQNNEEGKQENHLGETESEIGDSEVVSVSLEEDKKEDEEIQEKENSEDNEILNFNNSGSIEIASSEEGESISDENNQSNINIDEVTSKAEDLFTDEDEESVDKNKVQPHEKIEELQKEDLTIKKVEDLSESSEYQEEMENAIESALKQNPNAKSVIVVKYNENDEKPHLQKVDVDKFKEEMYKRQESHDYRDVEDILTESMNGGNDHVKSADEAKDSDNLDAILTHENEDKVKDEKEEIKENLKAVHFPKNRSFDEFKHNSLGNIINKESFKKSAKTTNGTHQPREHLLDFKDRGQLHEGEGTMAQQTYLNSSANESHTLKVMAFSDARHRAIHKIPNGVPYSMFLADYMGISGNGEYKPSANMVHYFGGLSEFHQHFADKAKKQVSFEDIDTLIGMISDLNGVFNTIFDLLPNKEKIEEEKQKSQNKNALDQAYDLLKFYSQLRGFINTVVYNRHLLIKDVMFLKDKFYNIHTDEDDMLYFYSLDTQFYKIKARGKNFDFDPKIELFLQRITILSHEFQRDIKTVLRTFFGFEKAIIFFDNDVRDLVNSVNVQNPIQAIKTVDRVIMLIIRLIEVKIDILKSMKEMVKALKSLVSYRTKIIDNLKGAEQVIHYHVLNKTQNIGLDSIASMLVVLAVIMFKEE